MIQPSTYRYPANLGTVSPVAVGETVGSTAGGIVASTVGPSLISALGAGTVSGSVLGPIGAAVGAIGGLLIGTLFQPDYNKINASNDANAVEAQMKQNLANWNALAPSQKTPSVQSQALAIYDALWAKLQQLCGAIGGTAGANCISDRDVNSPTVKWPWATYYRTPIANDPQVAVNMAAAGVPLLTQIGDVLTGGSNPSTPGSPATGVRNLTPLILPIGVLLAALILL